MDVTTFSEYPDNYGHHRQISTTIRIPQRMNIKQYKNPSKVTSHQQSWWPEEGP
jgi:hypothetical protein